MYKEKLLALGIPADIRGFEYLNYAIGQYQPMQKTTALYEAVAKRYSCKPAAAERSMRHAISKTILFDKNGNFPTVGQFVAKYKILWSEDK